MMKTLKWWAVGAALVLAAIAASSTVVLAHDDEDNDRELAAQLVQRGEILPLEQILQSASVSPERRGTILKTELDHERNHYVYEVKIMDQNGIVWEMQFDAKTGMLLRDEQDD